MARIGMPPSPQVATHGDALVGTCEFAALCCTTPALHHSCAMRGGHAQPHPALPLPLPLPSPPVPGRASPRCCSASCGSGRCRSRTACWTGCVASELCASAGSGTPTWGTPTWLGAFCGGCLRDASSAAARCAARCLLPAAQPRGAFAVAPQTLPTPVLLGLVAATWSQTCTRTPPCWRCRNTWGREPRRSCWRR